MMTNPFIGTWKLNSYKIYRADGKIVQPFGEALSGYIHYYNNGYMSVAFSPANRPNFEGGTLISATDEEKITAFSTFIAYTGKYEIKGNTVLHHVEVSSVPNWIGTILTRHYQIEGKLLTLTTPPLAIGKQKRVGKLVWEKIENIE